jgi:hypothetical protein
LSFSSMNVPAPAETIRRMRPEVNQQAVAVGGKLRTGGGVPVGAGQLCGHGIGLAAGGQPHRCEQRAWWRISWWPSVDTKRGIVQSCNRACRAAVARLAELEEALEKEAEQEQEEE